VNIVTTTRSEPRIPEEVSLIHKAKAGDSEAFAQLYDAYIERVYHYIYYRVTDEMTAEDIASQVFLKAWENLDRYQIGKSPFIAWLYTIARNQVIDHYRTFKDTVQLDEALQIADKERPPDEEVQAAFDIEVIRDALELLTDDQQQVIILKFVSGLTTEEIARQLDKREGAVRALQMRGLQTLAKYLEEKDLL
jgi:RNA polymerase sigma-70 factor (ECF subfamily)